MPSSEEGEQHALAADTGPMAPRTASVEGCNAGDGGAVGGKRGDGDGGGPQDSSSSFKYLLRVFAYNDAMGWVMNAVALACVVVSGTALPLMDIVFGQFVNVFNGFVAGTMSPAAYRAEVARYSLYFVYIFIGKFALTYIWTAGLIRGQKQVLVNVTAIQATKKLRVDFLRQLLRQEMAFFDTPSMSTSSQITTNSNLINIGISEKLGLTIQGVASFITAFIVAFAVQWKLTLIVVAIVPLNLAVTVACIMRDAWLEYNMFEIYSESGSLAEEALVSIRTAHAFWAFPGLVRRFGAILDRAKRVGDKKSLVYAILFPVEFFCVISGYALAFWQGMRMYSSGEIQNPGTVVTVIFAVLVAAQALTQVAPQTMAISRAAAAAQDVFAIIDRQSATDSLSHDGERIPDFQGDIRLRGVRFAYPSRPGAAVLRGLDLDVPAGRTTALVGPSGCGKSTIFGILERWYPVEAGSTVTFDGRDLAGLNLQWLRTQVRLVHQEPTLFSGTVFQNVADGLTGINTECLDCAERMRLVTEACKAAYAHDFIESLPNGYETKIGERGASLSGGQKQRIVIARSIISNPKVLLLDEATSALDPSAEKIVQAALNNVARGRTMVVIAHRLSTVRDADNIVVMSKGQAVESGSHAQLLARGGAYARLVQAQDLGQGADRADGDDDAAAPAKGAAPAALELTPTRSSAAPGAAAQGGDGRYGLLHGLLLILREQRPLWWHLAATLVCCVVGGGTYPALAILVSKAIVAFQTVDVARGNFFALLFFVIALVNFVAYLFVGWFANVLAQTVMLHYRTEVFNNTLRQDMSFFDRPENSTGALVSRIATEPTSLQELLSANVALLAMNAVNLLSSSVLAIVYGWKLGLVLVLGALPALVSAGYIRIRLESRFEQDIAARFAHSSGIASEAVIGIRTVSSLALERVVIARYEADLQGIATRAVGDLGGKMLFYALSQSISFLAMALGFWYGGRLVSTGEYSNGQFYIVFMAVVYSAEAAAMLFQYTTSITKAQTAINYILGLRRDLELVDEEHDADNGAESPTYGGNGAGEKDAPAHGIEVQCESLEFAYPLRPRHRVLRGLELGVGPGQMVALVGASGCGKSTVVALLERFYDPTAGTVRAHGRDVRTLGRRRYRRDVALVQQEPVLYQGSIRDNVALGARDGGGTGAEGEPPLSEDDIIAACRAANAWDFVASLPQGLDTPCGPQGLSLSGGQRQRIAIARALARRPQLLLLDEATSALDSASEAAIKQALARAATGRTTVAVAHRLSTVRHADAIAVVARGAVAELGSHDELIARRGLYYQMVLCQSLDREAA
ncbi:ABC transporter transmembrane domain-containing protein [Hirsutella rhossiliensis]|uniref:ABC transporter transmembrane domain-containing protein n=1 Tax=Hirsutella rhossiliensis TaxID=111463 RepID=A0A9P8MSB8_9HYPO|nr:ABC transporter transmembrane domain-containing protein [Hirsutella rhossiliensis]KAH0958317.1 ABC transporter transmembrane domain-containing protein [Hirsutella rhossiliensis]